MPQLEAEAVRCVRSWSKRRDASADALRRGLQLVGPGAREAVGATGLGRRALFTAGRFLVRTHGTLRALMASATDPYTRNQRWAVVVSAWLGLLAATAWFHQNRPVYAATSCAPPRVAPPGWISVVRTPASAPDTRDRAVDSTTPSRPPRVARWRGTDAVGFPIPSRGCINP